MFVVVFIELIMVGLDVVRSKACATLSLTTLQRCNGYCGQARQKAHDVFFVVPHVHFPACIARYVRRLPFAIFSPSTVRSPSVSFRVFQR